jgi:hypothetical protein
MLSFWDVLAYWVYMNLGLPKMHFKSTKVSHLMLSYSKTINVESFYSFHETWEGEDARRQQWHTGRPSFIIPDLAREMDSNEPPSAAKCSVPIPTITAAARPLAEITFVASRAPPSPVCHSYTATYRKL